MRRILVVLAFLAVPVSAFGTLRIFVTGSSSGYGLENNANAFIPTVSTVYDNGLNVNGYDYWADYYGTVPGPIRPGTFPPADVPSGTPTSPVVIGGNDFAYIWLQFQSEPKGVRLNGLLVMIREYGTTTPVNVSTAYYLCNNESNIIFDKRWDGNATPPNYPEWRNNNPQWGIAIAARGIINNAASEPWNLWEGPSHIALFGALAPLSQGTLYEIAITDMSYWNGPLPTLESGVFMFVPEPTSVLLLAWAGLLIRRR